MLTRLGQYVSRSRPGTALPVSGRIHRAEFYAGSPFAAPTRDFQQNDAAVPVGFDSGATQQEASEVGTRRHRTFLAVPFVHQLFRGPTETPLFMNVGTRGPNRYREREQHKTTRSLRGHFASV